MARRPFRAPFGAAVRLVPIALAVPSGAPSAIAAPPDAPSLSPTSQTRVLVQLAPGLVPAGQTSLGIAGVDAALARYGVSRIAPALTCAPADASLAADLGLDRWWVLTVPGGGAPDLAAELGGLHGVLARVEADGVGGPADESPDDPYFDLQWGLRNTGQVVPNMGAGIPGADISATGAWAQLTSQRGVILAVIDAGVNAHDELSGRLLEGWSAIDGNGDTTDQCEHGTHVAGIAAAEGNNAAGIAGVCWWAGVQPVRVIESDCTGYESETAAGIVWAADHGASIANISLQFYTGTQLLSDAVEYAHARGMLLVAAAGNNNGGIVAYPAKFDHCLAVSGTDNFDNLAGWSNYGAQIDVAAPGCIIYSLLGTSEYKYLSGTSMASPLVAGLACLVWSLDPALSADDVASIITASADDLGSPGWDEKYGFGRINAAAAVAATPCYADLDGDGSVTFADYLAFQNAFIAHDPSADCERTSGAGVFDLFDFLCFQNAFMSGCP